MLIIAKLEFSLLSLEHMLTKTNSNNQIMFSILEAEVGLLCHSSFWTGGRRIKVFQFKTAALL